METNFNLGSLKTIQTPLLEYLNSAHDNILKNIEVIRDEKKIPTNHDYLVIMDKLDKTFNMIGLHSLSIIFQLNKEALTKVAEVTYDTDTHLEILNVVLTIVDNTRTYIRSLSNGANEYPTKFFESYQSLGTLIRKDVNIKDLFNPRLELRASIQNSIRDELRRGIILNTNNKKNLLENLKVVENTFVNGVDLFHSIIDDNGKFESNDSKEMYQFTCKNIYEKLDVAQKLKISKSHYIMFGLFKLYICILSPVFNSEFVKFVNTHNLKIKDDLAAIKDVLIDLNISIKELEEGSKTGTLKVKDSTVKDIIFNLIDYIKENPALMGMSVYRELGMYFDLDYYAEQLLNTKMNSSEKLSVNISVIEKLFNELKEDFTLLDTKKKSTSESLAQHIQRLINVNNKLAEALLPIKEVHILASQFSATLSLVKSGKLKLTELIERELSIALVLVEYGVNNIIKNNVESRYKLEFGQQAQIQIARIKAAEEDNKKELSLLAMPKLDTASQKSDEKKSFAKIFEQVSLDLIQIEETLDNILRNNGEGVDTLSKVLKPLNEMRGIFSVVGRTELTPVLYKISEVWTGVQSKGYKNWEVSPEMKESIVLISGISLFVEAFKTENEIEVDEHYENILNRFNSGIFKSTVENDFESVVDVYDFDNEANGLAVDNVSVVVELDSSMKKPTVFSLEDEINNTEDDIFVEDKSFNNYLDKDEVIKEFNNFSGTNVERFVFLITNYLSLIGSSDTIIGSGKLLGSALANVSIEQSPEKNIQVSELKSLLTIDSLLKILKSRSKISNQTKQDIRTYLNSLPGTIDNKLSTEGSAIHNSVQKAISEMLNIVALNNMPVVELTIETEEKPKEIFLDKIQELKVYKETPNDEELLEFFLEEVFEILESLNNSIHNLERNYDNIDELTNVRRYFHTLKGSGRTIGLDYWGEAAWMTEQTLNRVLSGDIEFSKEIMSAIKYMKNFFEILVSRLKEVHEINVDLVTVKMMWVPLNNKMTHHVEVELPVTHNRTTDNISVNVQESLEKQEDNSISLNLEVPNFDKIAENKDEVSVEITNNPTEAIEEVPLDNVEALEILNIEQEENKVDEKVVDTEFTLEILNDGSDIITVSKDTELEIVSEENQEKDTTLIELLSTNSENKEVVDTDIDEKIEHILIDGKEVPLYLLNMYKDESINHITRLKEFVQDNYGEDVELDSNFMLHAHTLGSISKTVNLQKIARIANGLEDIAMTIMERDMLLSSDDMNILRHAVNNLELFQNINEEADISFFETLVSKLDILYEKLTNREENVESGEILEPSLELEVFEDKVSENEKLNEESKSNLDSVNITREELDELISQKVKKEVEEQLENSFNLHVRDLVNKHQKEKSELLENIEALKEQHVNEIKEFSQKVTEYKEKVEALDKVNRQIVKKYDETIKSFNIEIESLKNKSKGWLSKLFGK